MYPNPILYRYKIVKVRSKYNKRKILQGNPADARWIPTGAYLTKTITPPPHPISDKILSIARTITLCVMIIRWKTWFRNRMFQQKIDRFGTDVCTPRHRYYTMFVKFWKSKINVDFFLSHLDFARFEICMVFSPQICRCIAYNIINIAYNMQLICLVNVVHVCCTTRILYQKSL